MTDDIKSWSREELESAYVQRELQLKKLLTERDALQARVPPLDNSQAIGKRIKVLDACQKRWQEVGETECAAIYQGAAFELRLARDKFVDLEAKYKVLVEESTLVCNEAAVLCYVLGAFATAIEFTKGEIEKTREALKSTAKPNPPSPTQD